MPILTLEEMGLQPQKKSVLEEISGKPLVYVFDPLWRFHELILEEILGSLLNQLQFAWVNDFSSSHIEKGGISGDLTPALVARRKPVLIVSELVIATWMPGDYRFGLIMLKSLRREEVLKQVPLVIISAPLYLKKVEEERSTDIKELRAKGLFAWSALEIDKIQKKALYDIFLTL